MRSLCCVVFSDSPSMTTTESVCHVTFCHVTQIVDKLPIDASCNTDTAAADVMFLSSIHMSRFVVTTCCGDGGADQ